MEHFGHDFSFLLNSLSHRQTKRIVCAIRFIHAHKPEPLPVLDISTRCRECDDDKAHSTNSSACRSEPNIEFLYAANYCYGKFSDSHSSPQYFEIGTRAIQSTYCMVHIIEIV
jgi:hypothetical protein